VAHLNQALEAAEQALSRGGDRISDPLVWIVYRLMG
jgi:hypothetical protein